MYENGKRVNGYHRKMLHKRAMKDKYVKTWFYGHISGLSWEEFLKYIRSRDWYSEDDLHYWRTFYLSGCRSYAKYCTARKIRSVTKQAVTKQDYDDILNIDRGMYRKYFDYDWTIW